MPQAHLEASILSSDKARGWSAAKFVEVGRSSRLPARPEPVMLLHITSRSRKSTTDPLNMEHMRKQAGRKLAWTRCYRYTSSSDQLRVALLKLQPASRRGEHGRREAPYPIHRRVPFGDARGTFESALLSTPLSSTLLLTMRHKLTGPQIVLVSHMCDGSTHQALGTPLHQAT